MTIFTKKNTKFGTEYYQYDSKKTLENYVMHIQIESSRDDIYESEELENLSDYDLAELVDEVIVDVADAARIGTDKFASCIL